MLQDAHNTFSDADAVTASAASENVVYIGKYAGRGKPLKIHCSVNTKFESAALDGTLTIKLQSSAAAAFGSSTDHWQTQAIAEASLVAGHNIELPPVPDDALDYVRLYYTVGGSGDFTAGKLDAHVVEEEQSNRYDAMNAFLS